MNKVEIDGDTADRIVVCSLKESMKYVKEEIIGLKKKKKLEAYQKQELADLVVELEHLKAVYEYYGGHYQSK